MEKIDMGLNLFWPVYEKFGIKNGKTRTRFYG